MPSIRARVAVVHRASLQLLHAGALRSARCIPALADRDDPLARPGVGDWVAAEDHGPGAPLLVTSVEARRSALVRRAAGDRAVPQLLAANADVALLFAPLPDDVNPRRLVRLAALAWEGGVTPVVVLSRADKADLAAVLAATAGIQRQLPGIPVVPTSVRAEGGTDAIRAWLRAGVSAVVLGPSGAGKSTLVNALADADLLPTAPVRALGGGRHTTTHRTLIELPGGATIIDTPGLREVGMWVGTVGSDHVFADIAALAEECRFADCAHGGEPGCAVRRALESGALGADRFEQWQQLQREGARAERTVHEQRRLERRGSRAARRFYRDVDS